MNSALIKILYTSTNVKHIQLIILIPCYHQNLRGDFAKHPLFQQYTIFQFQISRRFDIIVY